MRAFVQKSWRKFKQLNQTQKLRCRRIVEGRETALARFFDSTILVLIILSIITYAISTLPNLSPLSVLILDLLDTIFYLVFTVELVFRLYASSKPLKYLLSFYGFIDLVTLLPFFLGTHLDLRSLRILRVFRLIKALKISRYNQALNRFRIALVLIKPELMLFSIISFIFMFFGAAGIYFFENAVQPENYSSVFSALWWSVITLTTIGYGDVVPMTTGGRFFTVILVFIGLGIVAIPSGLIASSLNKARSLEDTTETNIENITDEEIYEQAIGENVPRKSARRSSLDIKRGSRISIMQHGSKIRPHRFRIHH